MITTRRFRILLTTIAASGLLAAAPLVHTPAEAADTAGPTCAAKLAQQLSSEFTADGLAFSSDPRPGPAIDHAEGRAVDVLILDYTSPHMIDIGNGIENRALELGEAGEYPVSYVAWQQHYREPGGNAIPMEDRGSATQNHLDHLHISLSQPYC